MIFVCFFPKKEQDTGMSSFLKVLKWLNVVLYILVFVQSLLPFSSNMLRLRTFCMYSFQCFLISVFLKKGAGVGGIALILNPLPGGFEILLTQELII